MENNENGYVPQQEVPDQQPAAPQAPTYQEPAPQSAPQKDFGAMVNDGVTKAKGMAKDLAVKATPLWEKVKKLPKAIWIGAGAAVVVIIAVIVVLSLLGNTYKAPVDAAEKLLNSQSLNQITDRLPDLLNGFGESELETIISTIKKSEAYKENAEDLAADFEDNIDDLKAEAGDDYKIRIQIEDRDELEKEDLRNFRDKLRTVGKSIDASIENLDEDDFEDASEDLGLSMSRVKKMANALEDFGKQCRTAKVTEGYKLELRLIATGSELDEPQETTLPLYVYKVDGRWIPDPFSLMSRFGISFSSVLGMLEY